MPYLDEDGVTRLTEDYLDIFALKDNLDATKLTGTIPSANLPSYVDDVLEYAGTSNFPATGETGKIYVDTTDNNTYRWTGSAYVSISNPLDYATQSEAETGTNNTKVMTPLRTAQEIAAKTDSALSSSSNNPVRNSTIKQALDNIDNILEKHEENIAMIESSTAQSNHAIGSYFMLDNVLHKATSAIASGETITSGSNATPITIEEVLTALNTSVNSLRDSVFKSYGSSNQKTISLEQNKAYLLVTSHNGSRESNSLWLVTAIDGVEPRRLSSIGSNISITVSGSSATVSSSSGSPTITVIRVTP